MSATTADPEKEIIKLVDMIKSRYLCSPRTLAVDTFNAFNTLIKEINWRRFQDMQDMIILYADEISEHCRPHAIVAENVSLRILRMVSNAMKNKVEEESDMECETLQLLLRSHRTHIDLSRSLLQENHHMDENISTFLDNLKEELQTYKNELDACAEDISYQSIQYIHSNETVMVYGHSRTIEMFLKHAAKKRKFRVIVCQTSPDQVGHIMVERLSSFPNIQITLIPDSCIYAMMARVNKVILSCYSISADGSVCSRAGANALALSASVYGIPILVCTGLYKLSPRYHFSSSVCGRDVDYSFLVSPAPILDYYTSNTLPGVHVLNPSFDYIPASLISLFITNKGSLSPSYMYRLLKEMYKLDEREF
ncbi:hypothetical protein HZS_3070 [Henneguya salminicola]|uniref:Translation initiation factor eIF2B subunit beta n=1 Tax=Henneguya salminicola TaxID=69463 RepID=A0A6G3MFP1_HENSL|nr:hypothetical protein HZS_3070 [Henneguya salminicola]